MDRAALRLRRRLAAGLAVGGLLLGIPAPAWAHPLGNFTINQYLGLHIGEASVEVDLVVDMAEIPTTQERRVIDQDADGAVEPAEESAYRRDGCRRLERGLTIEMDSQPLDLVPAGSLLSFPPGQAGLDTLRLECRYSADRSPGPGRLHFRNQNYAERLGWREVVVTGTDVALATELPSKSITARLTAYPEELLRSPLDVREGTVDVSPAPGAAVGMEAPEAVPVANQAVDALASLITRATAGGAAAIPLAFLAAFGLGLVHAMAPGHGKAVMAAYLVGTRGTIGQALVLGLAVAVSHTIGVAALGGVTMAASTAFRAERVFPYLSVLSGLIVLGIGLFLVVSRLRRRKGHRHRLFHDHVHPDDRPDEVKVGWPMLAALGLSGGLVPSPSAVVLLLGAVTLGRADLGLLLIGMFGVGMSIALVGVGLALVTASRFGLRRLPAGPLMTRLAAILPLVMGVIVVVVGLALTANAAMTLLS